MVTFIDQHRDTYGVEPICAVLPIAPSTYFRHKAHEQDPARRSARQRRDDELRAAIQRVWDENEQVYGPGRCGSSCVARATAWPAAPSSA
jgi:putative transposase